jgi:PAS domain S-box-containing protein
MKVLFFKGLMGKLLLFFLLLDLTALGVMIFTVSRDAKGVLENHIEEHLYQNVRNLSHIIEEDLVIKWEALKDLSLNQLMTNSIIDVVGRDSYIVPFMRKLTLPGHGGEKAIISIHDYRGRNIVQNRTDVDKVSFGDAPWWSDIMKGIPHTEVLEDNGTYNILFAVPIYYLKYPEGALVSRFDFSFMEEIFERDDVIISILDKSGKILLGRLSPEDLKTVSSWKPTDRNAAIFREKDFFHAIIVMGHSHSSLMQRLGWKLVLSTPTERVMAPVERMRLRMTQIGIITAIVLSIIVVWRSREFVRPLRKLESTMETIMKEGDLSRRVPVSSHDEIGRIGKTFNRMLEVLSETTVSKEYLNSILNNMLSTLIVLDPDMTIKTVNPAAETLLGYDRHELIGKRLEEIMGKDMCGEELLKGGTISHKEKYFITKENKKIPITCSGSAICDSQGNITGFVIVAEDITQLKNVEEELRTLNESLEARVCERTRKLEESNKALEEFAYVASHDLQEPLRKVITFGDRLKDKYADVLSGPGLDYLERMQNASKRMKTLINDLLVFSRITTKAQPFEPVDLSMVVKDVLSDLEVMIEQTQAHIEVEELPIIEADPVQMRQLFQNLIGNALKFHKKGASPIVKIYQNRRDTSSPIREERCVQIIVEDNGIGFDEKNAERIFGVFQRLHSRSEYEGTGIGLSVCRKIVERHGGTIEAKSTPGQGARFIVTLPVSQNERFDCKIKKTLYSYL